MCRQCDEAPWGLCDCGCGKPRGKQGCTAHLKSGKRLCGRPPEPQMHVCRMHGGTQPVGALSPNYKHGKRSKLYRQLPKRYWDEAIAALGDPDAKNNRKQIALMESRANELFGQLSSGEHGDAWKRAHESLEALKAAFYGGDVERCQAQIRLLEAAVKDGRGDSAIWRELIGVWRSRADFIDIDSRTAYRKSVAMSLEEALQLAAMMVSVARELITDEDLLERFSQRIGELTPGGYAALAGSLPEN